MLKEKLDFPDYYGENLDALWDCLTRDLETPITIAFKGIDRLTGDMQELALQILQVFLDAEKEVTGLHIVLSQRS